MQLAGTVNAKTAVHASVIEAEFGLASSSIEPLEADLSDPVVTAAPKKGRVGQSGDPYKRISPPEYFEKLGGIVVPLGTGWSPALPLGRGQASARSARSAAQGRPNASERSWR